MKKFDHPSCTSATDKPKSFHGTTPLPAAPVQGDVPLMPVGAPTDVASGQGKVPLLRKYPTNASLMRSCLALVSVQAALSRVACNKRNPMVMKMAIRVITTAISTKVKPAALRHAKRLGTDVILRCVMGVMLLAVWKCKGLDLKGETTL